MKRKAILLILVPALCVAGQAPSAQSSSAQKLVHSGADAQKRGDLKSAIDDFRKALALQPDLLDAQIGLGAAFAAAGDFGDAIEVDRRSLDAHPDNAALRMNLGLACYRAGDLNGARREFETLHAANPADLRPAVQLGYTYNKLGREADAAALLTPLEADHEGDLDLEYALGYAMIATGKEAEGVTRVENVARTRKTPDIWMLAAHARFDRRQFHEALADAQEALQADPGFPGAHTLAGQAQYAIGNIDAAVAEFEAALKQNASDFTANLYLGILRFDDHDFDSARSLLELALSIHPQDPLTRLEVARLRNVQGNTQGALVILEDLEKSDPNWLDPHVELATIYYKLSRPEDGQREREMVKKLEALQQTRGPQKQ
jgi:tetratricopeptide (TPR) repeat protein